MNNCPSRTQLAPPLNRNGAKGKSVWGTFTERCTVLRRPVDHRVLLHAGFTLFEMLLVLGLMTGLLALTLPTLGRIRLEQQLKQGAEMVRLQMMAARLHALETGTEYQFRYEMGGNRFVAIPADYYVVKPEAGQGSVNSDKPATYWKTLGTFASKIHFANQSWKPSEPPQPLPADFLKGFDKPDDLSRVSWAPALVFSANGSAADCSFEIEDEFGAYVTISVRGITGSVYVSQLLRRTRR